LISAGSELDLYALYLDGTLSSQGLMPGWQPLAGSGAGRGLPTSTTLLGATVRQGFESDWHELAEPPGELDAIKLDLPPRTSCRAFEVKRVELPGTAATLTRFAVWISRDDLLVATEDGQFFRVNPDGAAPFTDLPAGADYAAGIRASNGELWLFRGDATVLRGDLEHGFTPGPAFAAKRPGISLAGSRPGGPLEIFALTLEEKLFRSDGTTWEMVGELGVAGMPADKQDVAWVAPGEAIAFTSSQPIVLHVRDGVSNIEHFLPDGARGYPTAAGAVPSLGLFVGTDLGGVFLKDKDAQGWRELTALELGHEVSFFIPAGCGVLMGTDVGFAAQYHPDLEPCPQDPIEPNFRPRRVIEIASGYALTSRHGTQSALSVVFLLERRP
jgi:hypothetical protein